MSINDLLNFKIYQKKFEKKLIKEIDYLKLNEKNIKLYLKKKHRDKVNFESSRMLIASKIIGAKILWNFRDSIMQ